MQAKCASIITSWSCSDESDDTVLQTQDSKFEPWQSEVESAPLRLQRVPTVLNNYEWTRTFFMFPWNINNYGGERVTGGCVNHHTRASLGSTEFNLLCCLNWGRYDQGIFLWSGQIANKYGPEAIVLYKSRRWLFVFVFELTTAAWQR